MVASLTFLESCDKEGNSLFDHNWRQDLGQASKQWDQIAVYGGGQRIIQKKASKCMQTVSVMKIVVTVLGQKSMLHFDVLEWGTSVNTLRYSQIKKI